MIDPDLKVGGQRLDVRAGGRLLPWHLHIQPLGGLGEEGTRGSQPGKLPSQEQARQGARRPSGQPCHIYNLGMRGGFLGISEGQPITSAHGPGNVT